MENSHIRLRLSTYSYTLYFIIGKAAILHVGCVSIQKVEFISLLPPPTLSFHVPLDELTMNVITTNY